MTPRLGGLPTPPGPPGAPDRGPGPLLRTSKLVKVYRTDGVTVEAVRGVDIELGIGEFVAIMGPSGSGKSTLLHVLGGLEPATSGEIWLRGRRVDGLSTAAWAILRRQHVMRIASAPHLLRGLTLAAFGRHGVPVVEFHHGHASPLGPHWAP